MGGLHTKRKKGYKFGVVRLHVAEASRSLLEVLLILPLVASLLEEDPEYRNCDNVYSNQQLALSYKSARKEEYYDRVVQINTTT